MQETWMRLHYANRLNIFLFALTKTLNMHHNTLLMHIKMCTFFGPFGWEANRNEEQILHDIVYFSLSIMYLSWGNFTVQVSKYELYFLNSSMQVILERKRRKKNRLKIDRFGKSPTWNWFLFVLSFSIESLNDLCWLIRSSRDTQYHEILSTMSFLSVYNLSSKLKRKRLLK